MIASSGNGNSQLATSGDQAGAIVARSLNSYRFTQ